MRHIMKKEKSENDGCGGWNVNQNLYHREIFLNTIS